MNEGRRPETRFLMRSLRVVGNNHPGHSQLMLCLTRWEYTRLLAAGCWGTRFVPIP
jgi:hypothetical protein